MHLPSFRRNGGINLPADARSMRASIAQVPRQRGGCRNQRTTGEAHGKICQQHAGNTQRATPAHRQLCDLQGRGGGLGSERGVRLESAGDGIERLARALRLQQPINKLFRQASCVAGIRPGGYGVAQPAILRGFMAAGGEPGLQRLPGFDMGAHPQQPVGGGDGRLVRYTLLLALTIGLALWRMPGFEAEVVAPLVEGAAQGTENRQDGEHGDGQLHRQPEVEAVGQGEQRGVAGDDGQ